MVIYVHWENIIERNYFSAALLEYNISFNVFILSPMLSKRDLSYIRFAISIKHQSEVLPRFSLSDCITNNML